MIWIIASGAGHHHSAVWCGPRNQPCLRSKERSVLWGSGPKSIGRGGSWKVTLRRGMAKKPASGEELASYLWCPSQSENTGFLVKTIENLLLVIKLLSWRWLQATMHKSHQGPGWHCWSSWLCPDMQGTESKEACFSHQFWWKDTRDSTGFLFDNFSFHSHNFLI